MADERDYHSHDSEAAGHEPTTADARAISLAMVALLGLITVALLVVAGLFMYFSATRGGEAAAVAVGTPIAPPPGVAELDPTQTADLRRLRQREIAVLTEFAWVDREAGVARIPIRRAMEILAQRATPTPEQVDDEGDNQ